MPVRGDIRSVQVPGAVDGWLALHERYGRLPLDDGAGPGDRAGRRGLRRLHHAGAGQPSRPRPPRRRRALPRRAARHRPDACALPGIARTLRAIAARRARRLLRGRVRPRPARARRRPLRAGGPRDQRGDVVRAAARRRLGPRPVDRAAPVAGLPDAGRRRRWPRRPGSGPTRTIPQWAHLLVETWRAVGHDRPAVLFDGADGDALLDPERLAAAAARVDRARRGAARRRARAGHGRAPTWPASGDGDTTHLCALDADGLGVSLTQSNALDFGSHLIEPTTGRLPAQPRRRASRSSPGHPAEVGTGAPAAAHPLPHAGHRAGRRADASGRRHGRRRPAADHRPAPGPAAAGRPGPGDRHHRAPAHPRRALGRARSACGGATTSPCWSRRTRPPAWADGLAGRGHRVRTIRAFDPVAVGCAQIIAVEHGADGSRRLVGASDPRSPEGAALGR